MNAIGLLLVWVAVQVSLFCLAGIALYAVARRRNPATGAWAAAAALAMAVGITALALSPWPRWWSVDETAVALSAPRDSAEQTIAADNGGDVRLPPGMMSGPIEKSATNATDAVADNRRQATRRGWQGALAHLRNDVTRTTAALSTPAWQWPAWLAVVILVGCSLALVRLLVAVAAAHWHRTLAKPVTDDPLEQLVERVRHEIGCHRPIELRETAATCSPSTIGWLRPAIILPADWRSWSDPQRRAVVAHEVAHVARGDFAVWLLAQLSVVVHFYNPLVHFLAARLRLEQEMAADVCGAKLAGGRQRYLTTLAEMALRQNDPPMAWAARPFLPSRGTLMKRVEMLHRQKLLPDLGTSHLRKAALAAMLLIAGFMIAGLRGPAGKAFGDPLADSQPPRTAGETEDQESLKVRHAMARFAVAQVAVQKLEKLRKQSPDAVSDIALLRANLEMQKAKLAVEQAIESRRAKKRGPPFDLDFVPNDADFLVALRPAALAKIGGLDAIRAALTGIGFFEPLGLPLEEIEECKAAMGFSDPTGSQTWGLLILRSKKPHDWTKLATYFTGKTKEVIGAGQKYYESIQLRSAALSSYWLPDDRTIVLASPEMITSTFSLRGPVNGPIWADKWNEVATAPAAAMATTNFLRMIVMEVDKGAAAQAMALLKEADVALFGASEVRGAVRVSGSMDCRSPASARRARDILKAALAAMQTQLKVDVTRRGGMPNPITPIVLHLAGATKLEVDAASVRSETDVKLAVEPGTFQKELRRARALARRQQSMNKLRRIAIAMFAYHEANAHFPPAVVVGPDGETPHSWRVELLPYMERSDLYDRYKPDEPWDSEHNRKLIAEGAELFSVPGDKANEDCGYFVVVGPGTVFDPANPPTRFRDIRDGTSWTIGVVEAKRAIPWTKPEDIAYDPNKPLSKFGGLFAGGFNAAFMDGSTHFLPGDVEEKPLRALLTRSGREVVEFDETHRPMVAE